MNTTFWALLIMSTVHTAHADSVSNLVFGFIYLAMAIVVQWIDWRAGK